MVGGTILVTRTIYFLVEEVDARACEYLIDRSFHRDYIRKAAKLISVDVRKLHEASTCIW